MHGDIGLTVKIKRMVGVKRTLDPRFNAAYRFGAIFHAATEIFDRKRAETRGVILTYATEIAITPVVAYVGCGWWDSFIKTTDQANIEHTVESRCLRCRGDD